MISESEKGRRICKNGGMIDERESAGCSISHVELDGKLVIKDVTFSLKPGEICALIGHNGAWKSMTMKTIMGLFQKTEGVIVRRYS